MQTSFRVHSMGGAECQKERDAKTARNTCAACQGWAPVSAGDVSLAVGRRQEAFRRQECHLVVPDTRRPAGLARTHAALAPPRDPSRSHFPCRWIPSGSGLVTALLTHPSIPLRIRDAMHDAPGFFSTDGRAGIRVTERPIPLVGYPAAQALDVSRVHGRARRPSGPGCNRVVDDGRTGRAQPPA